jgi:citrate synthase
VATAPGWRTAIAYGDEDSIVLRGHHLQSLIGAASFAETFMLLATGRRPTAAQARVLDAIFVAVIDHGIVPSSIVTRYLASCGNSIQAAVAGGVLAFGDTYGGAAQQLAQVLAERALSDTPDDSWLKEAATAIVDQFLTGKQPVPGYGHPLHPNGDPRVPSLLRVARECGVAGRYVSLTLAIEEALHARKKRKFGLNGDGVIAALALDLGLDWRLVRALIFVPRSAGLAVHAIEEMTRERGWRHVDHAEIHYDGQEPAEGVDK